MNEELYKGLNDQNQYFFTWEGDNFERIKVYRLPVYSLDERFNLQGGSPCLKMTDSCAEQFLQTHLNSQMFNKYPMDIGKSPSSPLHERMAFQSFGTDFSF